MAKTKLPAWLQKAITDTQGPMGLGQAPALAGAPLPQQMPLTAPQGAPEAQAMAPVAPPAPAPMFDFGTQQSNTAFRPLPPELRAGPYQFPAPPTMPTLPDVPIRNVSAENRAQGKQGLLAALIGGVLAGGEGAMAAMQGVRQGMQNRATADMGERERQYMAQMQRAQREAQRLQQEYANEVGQTKAQMGADDDYNQRALELWKGENTLYNNEENRALRESIAALTNETNLTKAQNQFMLGILGMGPRADNAAAAKARAESYGKDVNSRVDDRKADNTLAEDRLDFEKIFRTRQLDQADRRIGIDEAHKSWMRTNGDLRVGIERMRVNLASQRMNNAARGGVVALTPAQQRALEKDLATASIEIEKVRNGAGMKPDPAKHPDEYKLWQARRLAAEESAAELRAYYNEQAEMIGKRFDGNKYVSVPKNQPPPIVLPPITLPDPRATQIQTTASAPITSIFTPAATFAPTGPVVAPTGPTAGQQGFPSIKMPSRVNVNPSAQRGNRASSSAKPSPKPKPAPTPKPSFLTKEPKDLNASERKALHEYGRKLLLQKGLKG